MKKFLKNIPGQIASTYTIMLLCFTIISTVRGFEVIPSRLLLQLFGLAVIGGVLTEFAFGQCVFRKMSDVKRICIFIIPFCVITFLFAVMFQWITRLDMIETYVKFISIFLGCGILSVGIAEIEHRVRGKKYTQKLKEYQLKEGMQNEQ